MSFRLLFRNRKPKKKITNKIISVSIMCVCLKSELKICANYWNRTNKGNKQIVYQLHYIPI